jgi:hypothetical protein
MSSVVSAAELPEWTVSIRPIGHRGGHAEKGEDAHALEGFVATFAADGRRAATFLIDPTRRKKDKDAALAFGIHLILRREGRLDLHAAAVSPGADAGGLLIVGPKGVGKSSLTVALALSGWAFYSDDHVLTWLDHGHVSVAGLRGPLFLAPDAAARLPGHLAKGQEVPSLGKRMFQPEALFPGQRLAQGRIAAVVFPERSSAGVSTLERLRSVDCFQRLLALSPFLAADPSARPCIDVARGIADLPAFALGAGPDLLDPKRADELLRSALG